MNAKRRKLRRVRITTRKWNHSEEAVVLTYLRNYIGRTDAGPGQPTANQFFEQMSDAIKFDNITSSQMRNKIRNMHQKYLKAVDVKTKFGSDMDLATLESNVLAVCPHFHMLHEIFGTSASSRLPFQFASSCSVDRDEFDAFDVKLEPAHYYDDTDHSDAVGLNQSVAADLGDLEAMDDDGSATGARLMEKSLSMDQLLIPRASMNVSEPRHPMQRRAQSRNRHEIGSATRRLQQAADTEPTARERFEFDKDMRLKELELKKYAIDSDYRLRVMQLEKEERMEKLRIQMEHKVQMARFDKGGCVSVDSNDISQ